MSSSTASLYNILAVRKPLPPHPTLSLLVYTTAIKTRIHYCTKLFNRSIMTPHCHDYTLKYY